MGWGLRLKGLLAFYPEYLLSGKNDIKLGMSYICRKSNSFFTTGKILKLTAINFS